MRILSVGAFVMALAGAAAVARADTLVVPSGEFPTIQSAVDAAAEGDLVLVGPGTYDESVYVESRAGVEIRGRGGPVVHPPGEAAGFAFVGCDGVSLSGFQVEGGGGGVYAEVSTSVTLTRLLLAGSAGPGISLVSCDGVLVSRCAVSGAGEGISDDGSTLLRIEKCIVEGTTGDGLDLSSAAGENGGSNGAVVTKNRISSGGAGLRFGGEDAEISRNRFRGYGEYGIEIAFGTSSDRTVISRNHLSEGGGAVGIKVNHPQVTVSRNVLVGGAIYFDYDAQVAEGNRVVGAIWGVYMSGNNCTIAGNRMRDLQAFGVRSNGTGCTISGNVLAAVDGHGIEIGGPDQIVEGNRVSGAAGNGFNVSTIGNTFTGNRASGSGGADLRDYNPEGANTYMDNRFGTVQIGPDVIV